MPHGGPISRDGWRFSFLRAFLVSRGYAVLQMNFRGSSGYGWEWYSAAHQDWGGLTYSDIHDGTRWAIDQGIADPKRVAIVGWSFGGYAALLGAVRNSDVYRCAVSIAGVSDLPMLLNDERHSSGILFQKKQIGTDWGKLREDSPLRHVEKIKAPILLVHGTRDYIVEVGHSEKMAQLLDRKGKAHKSVILEGGTHDLDRQADRVALLTELDAFLSRYMQVD
jgi:dipeptidyl aminopeptidase/acylaminoacyl peptidase